MVDSIVKTSPRAPLPEGPVDVIVIGGGINGAGIARDVAQRGRSVVLVEKGDFGSGTSSASSKMLHGGIRYLEQLRLGLVYESLRERRTVLELAPHLARPQSFLIPVYAGASRGPFWIRLGLWLYDLLALGRGVGRSRFLGPDDARARFPELAANGLRGAGVYHDVVMDDARIVLANAIGAVEAGDGRVTALSYTEVTGVEPGTPNVVHTRDRLTDEKQRIFAHRVVRALGPWTDPDLLVRSKGIHILLPRFSSTDGLLLTHGSDQRVFFVIPWLAGALVGTTETVFDDSPDSLRVEADEVRYLIDEVRRVLPGAGVSASDIRGTFAGIRPLARSESSRSKATGQVSRVHRIVEDAGLLTVFGGKYTTYRAVAEEVGNRLFPGTKSSTRTAPLPGGEAGPLERYRRGREASLADLTDTELERLFSRYGCRLERVRELARAEPELAAPLSDGTAEQRAEVVYGIASEHVIYPEDFLARRTTLRFTPDGGRDAYDAVEELIREHSASVPSDLAAARERYFGAIEREHRLREEPAPASSGAGS